MNIQFFKYQGAGNDFIMINNRDGHFVPETQLVKNLCDRHFGIGADGLILLENDDEQHFSMRYYNSDGNEGSMCGNGGRCIVWFAERLGLIGNETTFNAIDGVHRASIIHKNGNEATIKLQMNNVEKIIDRDGTMILDTGSPHLVVFGENPDEINVFEEGRKLRYSDEFREEGINVNFIQIVEGEVKIRTYERGVENETLACGTGTVASCIAAMLKHKNVVSPVKAFAKGGNLKVYARREGNNFVDVWLEGPARFVFEGVIEI